MLRRRRYIQTRKPRHVLLTTRPTLSRPPKLPGVPSSSQSRAAEGGGGLGRVLFCRAIQRASSLVRLLLSENGFKTGQPGESGGRAKEKLHEGRPGEEKGTGRLLNMECQAHDQSNLWAADPDVGVAAR